MFDDEFIETTDFGDAIRMTFLKEHGASYVFLTPDSSRHCLNAAVNCLRDTFAKDLDRDSLSYAELKDLEAIDDDYAKLYSWLSDKTNEFNHLDPDQTYVILMKEALQFENETVVMNQQLTVMRKEEMEGKRLTLYLDGHFCGSVSPDSSLKELTRAKEIYSKDLHAEAHKQLDSWIEKAVPEHEPDWQQKPITLKSLDQKGEMLISPDTHKDVLSAIVEKRWQELSNEESDKIVGWINDSKLSDNENRIRVFHDGLLLPENSTEIDLKYHDVDFVQHVYKHLSAGAQLLPEHKHRLDRFYEDECLNNYDPDPDNIEVPTAKLGNVTFMEPWTDREVMTVTLGLYGDNLTQASREQLSDWINRAEPTDDIPNTIRVYNIDDPVDCRLLHKDNDADEIRKFSEKHFDEFFLTPEALEKAREWTREPELREQPANRVYMFPESPVGKQPDLMAVSEEFSQPYKFPPAPVMPPSPFLTLFPRLTDLPDKVSIAEALDAVSSSEHSKETEKLSINERTYTAKDDLRDLQSALYSQVENNFKDISGNETKQLLTWIHSKQNIKEPDPEPVVPVPTEDLLKLQRAFENLQQVLERARLPKEPTIDRDNPMY